jgi:hypothetical protein
MKAIMSSKAIVDFQEANFIFYQLKKWVLREIRLSRIRGKGEIK